MFRLLCVLMILPKAQNFGRIGLGVGLAYLHDSICTFVGQYVLASSHITLCGASSPREVLFGAKSYEMAPYCKASAWNLQQLKYLCCRIYKLGPTVRY